MKHISRSMVRYTSFVMSINEVRIILRFAMDDQEYMAVFSKRLTLDENVKLFLEILKKSVQEYVVMPYGDDRILDRTRKVEDLSFGDDIILYIYDFTK